MGGKGGATVGGVPTVVVTLDEVPISLALAGDRLYVTVYTPNAAGNTNTGKVESIAKTAIGASSDGGTAVTTLASGLPGVPGPIAVNGNQVLWGDHETVFPDYGDVLSVPVTGGSVSELYSQTCFDTRLPITNSVLYASYGNCTVVGACPLAGPADGGVGACTNLYSPHKAEAWDSDGVSLFFMSNGSNPNIPFDIYEVPVTGGTPVDLVTGAAGGSADYNYLVVDDTTVYWSDGGTNSVFSVPKAGGTAKTLATFQNGGGQINAQLVLDGANIYALWDQQLVRFPKAGGTPVVLAAVVGPTAANSYVGSGPNAISLAVDDSFVYWIYGGPRQIVKIAK